MRIVSLLPAATEMVYLLGIGDDLVGVSHECDYPSEASLKPKVTATLVDASRNGEAIQRQVTELSHAHRSLYELDSEQIRRLQPDLILTQEICDVCAVSRSQIEATGVELYGTANVISFEPSTLEGVLRDIVYLADLTGRQTLGEEVTGRLRQRVKRIRVQASAQGDPVVCLEWLQPPMAAGHWIPEMIEMAGGRDPTMKAGEHSRRVEWTEIQAAQPAALIVAPCGYSLTKAVEEYHATTLPEWWDQLPAVRSGRVFAIDGHNFTSRPGPRLVDTLEMIATVVTGRTLTTATYGVDYVRSV
jgi:iron complex transport system substrate-binding protein